MLKKSVCLAVLCALASTCWGAADEVRYFAIFMDGVKVGHCLETRRVEGERVFSTSLMTFTTERMGVPLTMAVSQEALETVQGTPISFKTVMDMSLMSQVVEGKIGPDGKLTVTIGGAQQIMDWPPGALMVEGVYLLQKRHGLKPGTVYSFVQFDTTSLRGVKTVVRVINRKPVDVLGKQEMLWEVRTEAEGLESVFYYDDDLKVRKSLMNEGGMNLEIVACSKEYALTASGSVDLLAKVLVSSPHPLEGLAGAASASYRLVPKNQGKLSVPSLANQKVLSDPAGLTVVVTAQQPPPATAMPYAGTNKSALQALKPTAYLNSDRTEVAALALQAVGNTTDAAEAVRRIEGFVHQYIGSKGYDVGYANAAEVVTSKTGDCTEHAVLAAAMCRAVGIPARVVAGMAYAQQLEGQQHVFCPHAWVMAYLGERWVQFDPTFPGGYDLGHIALASGDGAPADYLNLAKVMGAFRIEAVTVRAKPSAASAPTGQRSSPD